MSEADPTPLPLDADLEAARARSGRLVPVHLRPSSLATVFAGGVLGVAAREALLLALPPAAGIPWTVFAINVLGAFLLGALLEALARRGPDEGRRRTLRLLAGTGLLGGFTTYSTFAVDVARLVAAGDVGAGIAYGGATVVVGALATGAGLLAAAAVRPRGAEASR